jgi:hypothetical protein
MSLKFKNEIDSRTFNNLMEENANVVFELPCLVSNFFLKKVGFLDTFLSFLKKYEKKVS